MRNKLFVAVLVLVPAIAQAQVKIGTQVWQEKAYAEGQEASPAGGRLEVSGPFSLFGQSLAGGARFDATSLNGEAVDFSRIETLGNHAAFRAYVTRDLGSNVSVLAFGGFATALDKSPEPVRRYPREYGVGLRYTDKASGATFDVSACRSEATRASFGAGQVCFSGEVPVGVVRFGGDAYLDVKNDVEGKDLLRVRVGISVIDAIKAIR